MLRQRSVRRSGRRGHSGEGGEARGTGLACQTGEAHGTEHIPGELVPRIQVAKTKNGRKLGYGGGSRPSRRSKPSGPPGPTLRDGRTSRLRGGKPNQQLAGERQRGVVVTFGWQPCSEADRRSTLRRFRIRGTSHQPMSSERAGKSARAERKRVARLAVWCVEGRNEPVERSIVKTLVLARVARSVVAGYGFGRKHGRGSPNDRSVSNGWQVVMRESEVLP